MPVFASISHKGGTGRSVATANIGYQLSRLGYDVCIVDLDLASPTLGSVVGFPDVGAGAELGIHDILAGQISPSDFLDTSYDVWGSAELHGRFRAGNDGQFRLIPGKRGGGDLDLRIKTIRTRLAELIDEMSWNFDYVLFDLRSGIATTAEAFLSQEIGQKLYAWVLFHRWTRQHLIGVEDLASTLSQTTQIPTRFYYIRTAVIDMDQTNPDLQPWINRRNAELLSLAERLESVTKPPLVLLGVVPLERILQWSERILIEEEVAELGALPTISSFNSVARRLTELVSKAD